MLPAVTSLRARSLRHVRPVVPLHFPSSEPESERIGQSGRHYRMCKALYETLRAAAGDEHTVSCDAFVYFDAGDPDRKLAPDGAVKLGSVSMTSTRGRPGSTELPSSRSRSSRRATRPSAGRSRRSSSATARSA